MIRNRLAVLLAERELKISRVAEETNIARSTLTSISQNDSKMIQLETINELCNYLRITPCDFFEYAPLDITYLWEVTNKELNYQPYNFNILIKMEVKEGTNTVSFYAHSYFPHPDVSDPKYEAIKADIIISIYIDGEYGLNDFVTNVYEKLTIGFKRTVDENLVNIVQTEFQKYLKSNLEIIDKFNGNSIKVCVKTDFETTYFNLKKRDLIKK
ncbi:helix-turn-helix domain-containing protein [Bacillus cereus]|uniref:HTH cro/C1-type domain-containing protein n=1 Tax=Bacillus cereus VD184 TaxID=1053242 RepID=A0A9W5RCR3_BACCE|nr:helix-turn-helix transcriptional regulator [Bacillus cereus]EOQ22607.1 hypothetical protein IKC_06371 [Bacillus cereus VD184]